MNVGAALILMALFLPLIGAGLTFLFGRQRDVRDTLTIVTGLLLAFVCLLLFKRTGEGEPSAFKLADSIPGVGLEFRLEPLGALFALMASSLWAVNSLFAIGYMRGKREANQTRFYVCFALAMSAAMGVAMAGNLFTLFIFYELLTLATYPLVTHKGDPESLAAGRRYMLTLVGASAGLFLPAIVGVQVIAGTTEFRAGGLLAGQVGAQAGGILLLLMVFGAAKAAMAPLHGWLPAAMVAPAPVSALLHAVAVVKAGVFVLLKVSAYTFGSELMASMQATDLLIWLAAATIVVASLVALTRDELKARLAWSTIGQLAYVSAGALMATGGGLAAGGAHMLTHALGKITLFMCAGAIYVGTGLTRVSEMRGAARRLPLVFAAFALASLSIVGLPPTGGAWSKLLLLEASFRTGQEWLAAAMAISSILSAIYLLQIPLIGFAAPGEAAVAIERRLSSPLRAMTVALLVTAIATAALFFLIDPLARYLGPVAGARS